MAEKDEKTIPVAIDNLDYTPLMFSGFTAKELGLTYGISFLVLSTIVALVAQLFFGLWMFGPILGALLAAFVTIWAANKAYRLKAGRPSYLMWIDLQKRIQEEGYFGIKISMGLVKSTRWHTGTKRYKSKS